MEKLSTVVKTLEPSPIQQLSFLAQGCNAINLAEGFPDFVAPAHIKNAAVLAINFDFNQYRTTGWLIMIRKETAFSTCYGRVQYAQGSFFMFAELPKSCSLSDIEFVEELIKQAGVVAVPGAGFFHAEKLTDYGSCSRGVSRYSIIEILKFVRARCYT